MKRNTACYRGFIIVIGMIILMGCDVILRAQFCNSKRKVLQNEEVRTYVLEWIHINITTADDSETKFMREGDLGRFRSMPVNKIDFNWKMLGYDGKGIIFLYGKNLHNIEAVQFGARRSGILVSLRDDKQFPERFDKNDLCYQLGEFAVYYDDGASD